MLYISYYELRIISSDANSPTHSPSLGVIRLREMATSDFTNACAAGESERPFFWTTTIFLVNAGWFNTRERTPLSSDTSSAEEGRNVTPSPAFTMPTAVDIYVTSYAGTG